MKKNLALFSVIAGLVIMTSSCNNSASSLGPKEVLVAFFDKLSKKDVDGAAKLATKESQSTMSMMKMGMEQAEKMETTTKEKKDIAEEMKNIEFGDAKIEGDAAAVPVKNKKEGEEFEFEFPLKKEDGGWKVDFSLATMMKMAKERNGRMKDVNEEDMKKGLQMMDSAMKNMDPQKLEDMKKRLEELKKAKEQ